MSGVVRLTLLAHGMTEAMSAGRFPTDEPLNALGVRQVAAALGDLRQAQRVLTGPEQRTRQTALGLPVGEIDDLLADLDYGTWSGQNLDTLPAGEVRQWLENPGAAPHGGESVTQLLERVRGWLERVSGAPGPVIAVTHPAIIRAAILVALDASPASFWRIDIPPASRTVLHYRGRRWTLRLGTRVVSSPWPG